MNYILCYSISYKSIYIYYVPSVSERTKRFDWQRCLLSFNFSSLAMVNVLHSQIGWQPSGSPKFVDEVPIQLLYFEGKSQHVVVSIKHNQTILHNISNYCGNNDISCCISLISYDFTNNNSW